MTIRWEIYHKVQNFKLIDAALLWLEIEPSEELIDSPPYRVRTMQQVLSDAVNDVRGDELIQECQKTAESQGVSKVDVLKRFFKDPPKRRSTSKNVLSAQEYYFDRENYNQRGIYGRRDMAHEIVRIFGIDSESLTEQSWENLVRDWNANTNIERIVSRVHLIKVAEAWDEAPKFLFSEGGFEKEGGCISSYQKIIKILAHDLGIDLTNKNAVGVILHKAELAGINITDPTVLKILDEVCPSRLNNSNRKNRKTK
jgi:hypothetical protein